MGKSVYSVVLNDEVINLIDNLALKQGISRSTLINNVLADYVGYSTNRQRIEEILALITDNLSDHKRMRVERRQQYTIDFLSALNYKYNPRVTYSAELFAKDENVGLLKIGLRTTNEVLIRVINEFFEQFIYLEKSLQENVEYFIKDGKIIRRFNFKNTETPHQIALKLTNYVNNIDRLMNLYIEDYFSSNANLNLKNNYLKIKDNINY